MKKFEMLNVVGGRILTATNKTLEVAHAYKTVKFRKELKAAFEKYQSDELELLKEAGIEDPAAFDAEYKILQEKERTNEELKRLEELDSLRKKYVIMRQELLNEEAMLDCKTMPYEAWHAFVVENDIKPEVEDILEDVLWTAPEE